MRGGAGQERMARVYLTSTDSAAIAGEWWTSFSRLKQSSLACTVPAHYVVANPEDADIILFSDSSSNSQADVRNHALTKRFREKVFVYSTNDRCCSVGSWSIYVCGKAMVPTVAYAFRFLYQGHRSRLDSAISDKRKTAISVLVLRFLRYASLAEANRQAGRHQQICQGYVKGRRTRVRKEC